MATTEQIEAVLRGKVQPLLQAHGGAVELADYRDGIVFIKLSGVCAGCPSADMSTRGFIEDTLKAELPGVQNVELVHAVSSELLEFARQVLQCGN